MDVAIVLLQPAVFSKYCVSSITCDAFELDWKSQVGLCQISVASRVLLMQQKSEEEVKGQLGQWDEPYVDDTDNLMIIAQSKYLKIDCNVVFMGTNWQ